MIKYIAIIREEPQERKEMCIREDLIEALSHCCQDRHGFGQQFLLNVEHSGSVDRQYFHNAIGNGSAVHAGLPF